MEIIFCSKLNITLVVGDLFNDDIYRSDYWTKASNYIVGRLINKYLKAVK